ncbi:MAG: hypothetical protein ABJB65_05295 [Chloroflexota bacterium]
MTDQPRETDLEQRIRDLEQRLNRYEGSSGPETAFWALMHRIFPEDARKHMKVATREQLITARGYIDRWITRLDDANVDAAPPPREDIEVK